MKAIVRLKSGKRKEQIEVARIQLLVRLLLNNKICLSEINQNIRIKNPSIYVTALRLAREENSVNNYINILNILYSDICICKNKRKKDHLKRIFLDYINLNPFQGEIQFEDYKNVTVK